MPNQYRLKNCPTCGVEHRKKGPYCSRSCGNGREFTEEQKKNLRVKNREYYQTPEGIATAKKISSVNSGEVASGVDIDEWSVDIPDVHDLRDYDNFLEGFDRADKW